MIERLEYTAYRSLERDYYAITGNWVLGLELLPKGTILWNIPVTVAHNGSLPNNATFANYVLELDCVYLYGGYRARYTIHENIVYMAVFS